MEFKLEFFDDFEEKILDAALYVMKKRVAILNTLQGYELTQKGLGIEGWFTIELLTDEQFHYWGTTKIQTPADLKIRDKFVEIKALSDTNLTWITDWWVSRKIKPEIVLFLSVFNENLENQIENSRDHGCQIKYKKVNKDWIVGIFDGMNQFWCELWESRKEDIRELNIEQLNKILDITKKYVKKWVERVPNEIKIEYLKEFKLEDPELVDKILDTAFEII